MQEKQVNVFGWEGENTGVQKAKITLNAADFELKYIS